MGTSLTRRKLLGGGLTAAAASWATQSVTAGAALASANADAKVLGRTLEMERLMAYVYRRVLATPLLRPEVRTQLALLLAQELEHVATLQAALARLGANVRERRLSPQAAQTALTRQGIHWQLGELKSQHDCLKLLVDVESLAENAYFEAIGKLQESGLLRTSAAVMGCEAQHWTVLSGLLNHNDATKAVPYPFVGGSP